MKNHKLLLPFSKSLSACSLRISSVALLSRESFSNWSSFKYWTFTSSIKLDGVGVCWLQVMGDDTPGLWLKYKSLLVNNQNKPLNFQILPHSIERLTFEIVFHSMILPIREQTKMSSQEPKHNKEVHNCFKVGTEKESQKKMIKIKLKNRKWKMKIEKLWRTKK